MQKLNKLRDRAGALDARLARVTGHVQNSVGANIADEQGSGAGDDCDDIEDYENDIGDTTEEPWRVTGQMLYKLN
ncbi:MAG: hypothetical protein PV344_01290, partial [Anaplasma sp.]|nr:hypothetical protein [Anaplasma sp.]